MKMRYTHLSLVVVSCTLLSLVKSQQCYHHNGTVTTDLYHAPCSNNTADPLSSICCAIGRPNAPGTYVQGGYTADKCLDNGVCQNTYRDENNNVMNTYWREECTFADWSKGKCLTVCMNGSTGNARMTPCDGTTTSEKWCCGQSDSCCNGDGVVSLAKDFGVSPSSTAAAASPTTSSSTSSSATSIFTPPAAAPSSSSLTTGAKAGIAIGAIAGISVIFSAGYLIARRKHTAPSEHGKAVEKGTESDGFYAAAGKDARPYVLASTEVQEMNGQVMHEAPNGQRWKTQELP